MCQWRKEAETGLNDGIERVKRYMYVGECGWRMFGRVDGYRVRVGWMKFRELRVGYCAEGNDQ